MSDYFLPLDGDGEAIESAEPVEYTISFGDREAAAPTERWCEVCKTEIAPGASHNSAAHALHVVQGAGGEGERWCAVCKRYINAAAGESHDIALHEQDDEAKQQAMPAKAATNWTRDGTPIVDGFEVITREEANRIPFLDNTKVIVSDRHTCPDCNEPQWLSTLSSCSDCSTLKCTACMAHLGSVFGQCKKCANWNDAIHSALLVDDSELADTDYYLNYAINAEPEESLFLPGDNYAEE